MDTAEIRRRWLAFFQSRGHAVVPSAPLLYDDPTLLFVNAGMVPFKPYFLGQETPPWKRATSVQKCIRTPDIDEVGKTSRHGTFFQMNGNFSFGDYFKADAITFCWGLMTSSQDEGGYGLDPDRLWATAYHDDDETAELWAKLTDLPPERIQRRGMEDNLWSMGIPGPCGPTGELFIDRGPAYGREGGPAVDEDRYMELWNLVFMQYLRGEGGAKTDYQVIGDLPAQNVDTGLGLERLAAVLQDVDNLYEIDEVRPVLDRAAQLSGKTYGAHSGHRAATSHPDDVRLRIVADHVRSSLMLIGDGVTPGNEGRGYVLRRLLRRGVRAMRLLGVQDPSLPELLPVSMAKMSASYPELRDNFGRISQIAYAEEEAFRRTLAAGTTILDTAVARTKAGYAAARSGATGTPGTAATSTPVLTGADAFALHDTYGFPIDLTLEMASEHGVEVDQDGFRALMEQQRQRAKADARAKKGALGDVSAYRELRALGPTEFRAYVELESDSRVVGILRDGERVERAGQGERVEVVLTRTPFYAESGGQVADEGVITADGLRLRVLDVQRPVKGLIAHSALVERGELRGGQEVQARVDREWRLSACQAHSGTHVIHAALRQVLGPSALQSGSYNKPGYLRLDFAWPAALSPATRSELEEVANLAVRQDLSVSAAVMPLARAREIGALALFGETYSDDVRVIEIGGPWSRELCGGTHVRHSSQIGALSLTGESSVGAGVRRVEALVGMDALRYLGRERALVAGLSDLLKVAPEQLTERVEALLTRVREAERAILRMRQREVLAGASSLAQQARDVSGVRLVSVDAGEVAADGLRSLALDVRGRLGDDSPAVVAIAGAAGGRPVVVVATNPTAREWGLSAGALAKVAAQALGGGGGGKDDLAQGGGTDATAVGSALQQLERAVGERVTSGRA